MTDRVVAARRRNGGRYKRNDSKGVTEKLQFTIVVYYFISLKFPLSPSSLSSHPINPSRLSLLRFSAAVTSIPATSGPATPSHSERDSFRFLIEFEREILIEEKKVEFGRKWWLGFGYHV
ncbi:hypothetical protein P8452_17084 [Trifolium repens]|nr:hypothetical protein P8452_17084 [Trifolium repens]